MTSRCYKTLNISTNLPVTLHIAILLVPNDVSLSGGCGMVETPQCCTNLGYYSMHTPLILGILLQGGS